MNRFGKAKQEMDLTRWAIVVSLFHSEEHLGRRVDGKRTEKIMRLGEDTVVAHDDTARAIMLSYVPLPSKLVKEEHG